MVQADLKAKIFPLIFRLRYKIQNKLFIILKILEKYLFIIFTDLLQQ